MSKALILGSMTVAVADATVNNLTRNTTARMPSSRILIGGFVVSVGLLLLSDANEQIADTAAILILLAVLFGPNGGSLNRLVAGLTTSDIRTVNNSAVPTSGSGLPLPKI